MIMLRGMLLSLLLSCNGMRTIHQNQNLQSESDVASTEDLESLDDPPEPVNWGHWLCCRDLCGKTVKDVVQLAKEVNSPYLVCYCRDGRIFRVRRLKGPTPKG